ncbi:MAG TPA: AAA family ATPase, partial [Gemmatimonadales bacterium]|nr:AAA family ATPase [Gemmatimonadales bacterium]
DVDEFERATACGDWSVAARVCGGEFAEGLVVPGAVTFDQWLEEERRHFRAQGVVAISRRAELLLDEGRSGQAADEARRALALDRLAERAVLAVVRSRLMMGDVRGARESGQEYLGLCAELGVPPSHEVVKLLDRELPPGNGRQWSTRQPGPPLVGRERELTLLREVWETTCLSRQASLVAITGEPGMGVSRLLSDLAARARLEGASVVRVAGVPADQERPWSGVLGLALGGLLGAKGLAAAPPGALGALARRLAEWRERYPGSRDEGMAPDDALAEIVAVAADEAPLLVVLDNAHRLDTATLDAVPGLLRRWAGLPVMVAVGASSIHERVEVDELRQRAGREVPGMALRLGALSVRSIRALAATMLPTYTEPQLERLVRRVVTDSAGIPLLVIELLIAVSRGLELDGNVKAWPATERTLEDSLPGDLPDAVMAALRVNFRMLSPAAQEVLAAVAALPEPCPAELLACSLEREVPAVQDALDELQVQRWLATDGRGYTFAARLIRRVIGEDMLTPGQRRRVLERAARCTGGDAAG